ncbi:MAG: phenylalanine--tRNA ligase subunit beta, partial [Gammaproteobacteria bacterium]|nr:phenylalanine--tRNA ligase subunit beta [Gammaproteobacteria bacterium]NIN61875.1 phenylalanine--tRNA ligase subunit beta [Gammaproteobacteria bacterium]NIO61954.1 phenylalanine--tRNA ligase subunit beta [Gammaproteobacteria bacterium]NIQ19666.1 phenylalanine--tRNA ligase subunit beta [Gammaproteobacteria bacterium]NIT05704.1 phenylalanine--tRNA ligase subunit beta [Gammaproteobacteria bacterium]
MKLSEHWLREWINPAVDINQLAEQLTMTGLEVEGIEPVTLTFTKVIVARVDSVSAHPDTDKLRLCKINTGSETIDVVCGAPNVRKGMLAALAQVGARLPGIGTIKTGKIRGVISQGMLCSAADLGLSEDAEGLIELPEDSKPGQPLSELLTNKDNIIEVSLTPNRGDCLSVFGLARELSVIHGIGINTPPTESINAEHREQRKIHLEASAACPHYAGRVITGVDSGKTTPLWMQERLERSGIRCINVVVDITNYVMMSLGQPMHAFDNDRLNGDIHVRFAHEGETLTLLDHQECAFSNEVLLIADDTQALAMAGIMGGLDSAVTKESQNIFLESACFAPTSIIGQARRYGLHSESSHRFERGVDFTLQVRAIDMATSLILSICGGSSGPVTESSAEEYLPIRDEIELRKDQIIRVLGIDIEPAAVTRILSSLGMLVIETATGWTVVPPSWRFDITIEADLLEELARIHGYDQIPGTVPLIPMHVQTQQHEYQQLQRMRNLLVNRDYQEAITYSFVDQALQRRITPGETDLELINPIASDLAVMRTSLLPGLLRALIFNINRQQGRIRLFEYGLSFHQEGSSVQQ